MNSAFLDFDKSTFRSGEIDEVTSNSCTSLISPGRERISKVILIVDDDQRVRTVLQRLLFEAGYATIAAADGWQGVELAKTRKPDLIVMDILMPNMDGLIACNIIKRDSVTGGIPIVIFTEINSELGKEIAKEVGADRYITKPFGRDKLLDAISQLLPTS